MAMDGDGWLFFLYVFGMEMLVFANRIWTWVMNKFSLTMQHSFLAVHPGMKVSLRAVGCWLGARAEMLSLFVRAKLRLFVACTHHLGIGEALAGNKTLTWTQMRLEP